MKNPIIVLALLTFAQFTAYSQSNWGPLKHPRPDQRNVGSHKMAEHNDYPLLNYQFEWNDSVGQWDSTYRSTFTYSSTGLLLERLDQQYDGSGFWDYAKTVTHYNAQSLPDSSTQYFSNLSVWDPGTLNTLDYDPFGNTTLEISYVWNGSSWDSTYGRRSSYQYVYTDHISQETIEYWDYLNHVWTLDERDTYGWSSPASWDSVSFEAWNGSWMPDGRTIVYGWHNFSTLLPDSALLLSYNGSSFDTTESIQVTYGPYDSFVWTYYDWTGSQWLYATRSVSTTDSLEHNIQFDYYDWNAAWELTFSQKNNYAYDGLGHTLEIVYDGYDQNLAQYVHSSRIVYPSFFTEAASPVHPQVAVTAYPNPCTDRLNFCLQSAQNSPVEIALYDLQGRLRVRSLSPTTVNGLVDLPISEQLENGTYLYRVTTKQGTAQGKVVLQR